MNPIRWVLARRWAIGGCVFAASFAVALWLVRPFHSASIGPDAAAQVIEFERLIAGRQLEGTLLETSKPLLTIVYGLVRGITGDWRAVALVDLAAFSACVVLGAELARRTAGWAGSAFVAIGILISPPLLLDISLANALTWAVLSWLVAGLAVTAERPRYEVAGIALALGALARPETLALTGVATLALVGAYVVAWRRRSERPPRSVWLVLLGWLAIPALMAHDLVLFGDPLFWTKLAQLVSASGRGVRTPLLVVRFVLGHIVGLAPLLPLSAVGFAATLVARRWALAVGLFGATAGIAVFWSVVGARGTAIDSRYLESMDLGFVVAAGIGLGSLVVPALSALTRDRIPSAPARIGGLCVVAALCAVALAPAWVRPSSALASARVQVQLHANEQEALTAIRSALVSPPSWRSTAASTAAGPVVLVTPPRLRAQLVVDLDLPLWAVEKSLGGTVNLARGRPAPGTIVYHDRLDDDPTPTFAALEVDQPTTIGSIQVVPILVDRAAGIWVVRIEAAPTP